VDTNKINDAVELSPGVLDDPKLSEVHVDDGEVVGRAALSKKVFVDEIIECHS